MSDLIFVPPEMFLEGQISSQELSESVEDRFYQRVTRIKVCISRQTLRHIRSLINSSLSQQGVYDEKEDDSARLANRAVIELLLEVLERCNKKLCKPGNEINLTFSLPQAWAFSELYYSISAESLNNYTFSVINPIIDRFNKALS